MGRLISEYAKISREIIRKEGYVALIKKIPTFLDIHINKALSRFHKKGFHKVLYYSIFDRPEELNVYWLGIPTMKCPLDTWIYQEIIWETKPDFVIETGTAHGGSAAFFASIYDLIGKGKVITIDTIDHSKISNPRIKKIIGDSVSDDVIKQIKKIVGKKTAIVILDSDHSKDHVLKEMELYSNFVSIGDYLIVEDTNINGHPVLPGWGKGPMEAVEEFLKKRKDFEIDYTREKFLLTFHPKGFLKRIK